MMNGPIKKSDLLPKKEKNTRLARFARRVRGILSSNWFLRIFSVLIAVFLWGVLIASDGTLLREKIFQDVEVTVTGADTLRTRGFIVLDDVASLIPTVRMRVEVPQANYSRATGSSYNAHPRRRHAGGRGHNLHLVWPRARGCARQRHGQRG